MGRYRKAEAAARRHMAWLDAAVRAMSLGAATADAVTARTGTTPAHAQELIDDLGRRCPVCLAPWTAKGTCPTPTCEGELARG